MQPQSQKLYDDVKAAIDQIIAKYKELAADGLSFSEVWTLFQNATATLIQLVQKYGDYSGEQKKEVVIEALGRLYDEVIAPIDLKGIPNFLEPIVDRALKQLLLTFAGPAIDSLVNIFNKTGWGGGGQSPSPAPDPIPGPQSGGPDFPGDFEPY
jgi:hypothetical protein